MSHIDWIRSFLVNVYFNILLKPKWTHFCMLQKKILFWNFDELNSFILRQVFSSFFLTQIFMLLFVVIANRTTIFQFENGYWYTYMSKDVSIHNSFKVTLLSVFFISFVYVILLQFPRKMKKKKEKQIMQPRYLVCYHLS